MSENKSGLLIGSMVGVSSLVRDITHRKQIEAALRERDALRYVASLAEAAAHEINNPLAVVVGNAQLLAEEVDAAGRPRIEKILEAVRRIQGIVDQLKHINRLELMDAALPVPEMLDLERSSSEKLGPGGVAEAHPSVAGRRSRMLMAEHRGQLAKTQSSTRAPSSTTRFGGMLKKSVAAFALRAMKLNRRFRHRIIGAGPVGRSRELST